MLLAVLIVCFQTIIFSQDSEVNERQPVIYTLFINIVPDSFKYPLVGFINIAEGNQQNQQAGFVNLNEKALTGMQLGYVNSVGEDFRGFQCGFINSVRGSVTGPQVGFVNVNGGEMQGPQIGFINTVADVGQGVQAGFINTVGSDFQGIQTGFINNTAGNFKGAEIGFINSTKKLDGLQFGFINYVDTVENGIPIGFLSFVRKGGYKAFELSSNETYPLNLAFKIGIPYFYTSFNLSYNDNPKQKYSAGFGIGSNIKLTERSFLNPEYTSYSSLQSNNDQWNYNQLSQLAFNYVRDLRYGLSLLAGPTISWKHNNEENSFIEPVFTIYKHEISSNNKIHLGANVGIRYEIFKSR